MSLTLGTRIGPYEIVSAIGAGGMGEVYRARDHRLDRNVAIKVLPEALATDAERIARFEREAKTLAALNHPNIAHIHGLEESDGTCALVMELFEGPTLADRIAKGPLPLDEALPIARQIAEALEAAHEQGIIHRDLKPANVKVRDDGTVKVLDFGLAKALEPTATSSPNVSQSPTITTPAMMTGVGVILGTAAYMSPEQAKGRPADKRSDAWAFGCVLYEMLTGKRAFEGEDVSDTLAAVLRGEPDWTALPADVPAPIQLLLRRCLERDRSKRVSDVSVGRFLITDPLVTTLLGAAGPPPVAERPAWKRALPAVVSAIAAATVAGVAVWLARPSPAPQGVMRFTYELPADRRFTNAGRHVLAISPDGTRIVYVANGQLFLKSLRDVEAVPIRGIESKTGVTSPVFSPDGGWIAFWAASGELKKIPIEGGTPVTLGPLENPFGMSWDGDSILVGGASKGILRVSARGGVPEVLIPVKENELAHGPQLLPGGRSVLYTLAGGDARYRNQLWDAARIVVQTIGSTERKTIIDGGSDGRYVASGHLIYAVGGVLFAVPFDVNRLEAVGGPYPVLEGVARPVIGQTGSSQFSVSRNGSLVYVPGPASANSGGWSLALFDRKGAVEPLKLPPQNYVGPRFSPKDRRIAVGVEDDREANIWVYDLAGTSAMRQLTFGGKNRFPIWTPDGARITFQSDREGDQGIFWQRADGSGLAERLTTAASGEAHAPEAWFPNGDRLLLSVRVAQESSMRTFTVQDRKTVPFETEQHSDVPRASVSPDGRWVAYNARQGVFVQPFPPTGVKFRIGPGVNPFWAPDGKALFYTSFVGGERGFSVVTVTTQPSFEVSRQPLVVPRPVPAGSGGPRSSPRQYDIAPDGEHFIIATSSDAASLSNEASRGNMTRAQINFVLNWFTELQQRVPTK